MTRTSLDLLGGRDRCFIDRDRLALTRTSVLVMSHHHFSARAHMC